MIIYFFYVVCYQTFSYSVVKSIFLNENLLGGGNDVDPIPVSQKFVILSPFI